MQAFHDTRQRQFRDPFGAALEGSTITLAIDVWDGAPSAVFVRTWFDGIGERKVAMTSQPREGCIRYSATIRAEGLGNLWYCFILERGDEGPLYYGPNDGMTGGAGRLYDTVPPSYQITCFRSRPARPLWYRRGVVYQIFPDRFKRGGDWRPRAEAELAKPHAGVERALVDDWETPVGYQRDATGRITRWDFYGGNLEGIREELPRLAELGITVLYLNPIFQATSNHRYDTGDYLAIDPLLGDEEDFRHLADDARSFGIDLIIDGVFNHTGDDSRYFNRYGNYSDVGAWQSETSPYRSWYQLSDDGRYESWWGVSDLPATDKADAGWQSFIYGPDGVVEHWSRAGARGWRLDVADELTDSFIAGIKAAQTRVDPEGLLIGEVWEDASNKVSYGTMRHYLNGDELDSVMNYPFRIALLGFLTGRSDAPDVVERLLTLKENYPPPAFYETLNLLGSHDRTRLVTILGDAPVPDSLTPDERATYRLTDGARGLAKGRFWLALLLQMTSAGVPCIYYGDEAGLEGYTDPHNRGTYPWGHEDPDMLTMTRNALALRQEFDFLVDGGYEPFAAGPDVLGLWRWRVDDDDAAATESDDPLLRGRRGLGDYRDAREAACVLVNRSLGNTCEVRVPMVCGAGIVVDELISGRGFRVEGDEVVVTLAPFGSAFLYFHERSPIAQPLEPGRGILCSLTSLAAEERPGTLGEPAMRFIDFLAESGQRYWQVLPVTPPDSFGSPYAGLSAYAGNPALIAARESLAATFERFRVDRAVGLDAHGEIVEAAEADDGDVMTWEDFGRFAEAEASWLAPYSLFMALKDRFGDDVVWQQWPKEARALGPRIAQAAEGPFSLEDLAAFSAPDGDRALYHAFCQWLFQIQWARLLTAAHVRGVRIIGDIPLYVSEDSADTWSRPEVFCLDEAGYATEIAGTPPDRFAAGGQLWGNPTYDWRALRADDYRWWIERLRRVLGLYDCVRLDHFLGFEHYYSIRRGDGAADGRWLRGPGRELFDRARAALGPLPCIAEDLGSITPAIRGLVAQCGFPAMDVVEFMDGDARGGFRPMANKIVYTSTHDTDTLLGWVRFTYFPTPADAIADDDDAAIERTEAAAAEEARERDARALADALLVDAIASEADVVIVPLQDVIGLGTEGRMNVPGQAEGNWRWQATAADIEEARRRFSTLNEALRKRDESL